MFKQDLALFTDFYQLTMAASYFDHGMDGEATFSMFAHDLPRQRGFAVAAGLEEALDYLEGFKFSAREIDYLKSLGRFKPEFLEYLASLRFTGEVWAMPEGRVFFAGEPIIEVTGPIIEAQLVETFLLNTLNLHSTLASKAARCMLAAEGRPLADFSLRRTQGLHAGLAAARSSALVGFASTSNVAAAMIYGLIPVGTMAHSFVEAFGSETAAFTAFTRTFPDHTVFLVDTYDSEAGLKHAVQVARKLGEAGHRLIGVRLDSGDLVTMSRRARELLDEAGLGEAKVMASGSLDETVMARLIKEGAMIDTFGVGTKMGSSADAPYLNLAYKLVSYQGRPTLKLSSGKESLVFAKQVFRSLDESGKISRDLLCLREEEQEGEALLKPVMQGGRRLEPAQGFKRAQERHQRDVSALPAACLPLRDPAPLKVQVSPALRDLQTQVREAALARN